jgi:hypothetical protein
MDVKSVVFVIPLKLLIICLLHVRLQRLFGVWCIYLITFLHQLILIICLVDGLMESEKMINIKSELEFKPCVGRFGEVEIPTRYSRSTTKKAVHICCHPLLLKPLLQVTNTRRRGGRCAPCIHRNQYTSLPLQTPYHTHHEFRDLCQNHVNLYLGMSHGTDKKTKLFVTPS